jgi:hypothetical protein
MPPLAPYVRPPCRRLLVATVVVVVAALLLLFLLRFVVFVGRRRLRHLVSIVVVLVGRQALAELLFEVVAKLRTLAALDLEPARLDALARDPQLDLVVLDLALDDHVDLEPLA